MRGLSWMIALAWACTAAGCNGDDDGGGGSCGGFQSCGGDVEGAWTVDAVCFDDPESLFASQLDEPECDDVFSGIDVRASGNYTFANGTGSTAVTLTIDVEANWTEACLSAVNNGATVDLAQACPMLEATYLAQATFEGAACNIQGDVCACMLTAAPMMIESSGAYHIEGNELIDDADGDSTPYCVAGDTLTLRVTSDSLSGTITLSR